MQIPVLKISVTEENKLYHNPRLKWLFKILLRNPFPRCLLKLKCECYTKVSCGGEKRKDVPRLVKKQGLTIKAKEKASSMWK